MISIAIDGPAGAGKSTISRAVSARLNFIYVDTGAMYRAIALYAINKKIDLSNISYIVELLKEIKINIIFKDGEQRVILCEKDVNDIIRMPRVSMAASKISQIKEVREFLLGLQRDMAKNNNVLMDGRDIGTVVLPNASLKIFLTASLESRAKRRYKELIEKGIEKDYEEVLNEIKKRDYDDSHRIVAPLIPAHDAIIVNTTKYNLEESINLIENIIRENVKWDKGIGYIH